MLISAAREKAAKCAWERVTFLMSGCLSSRALCYLEILLMSWVATSQYFSHREAKIRGRNLNLEAAEVLPSLTGHQWSWGSETLSQLDEEQPPSLNVSR